MMLKKKEEKELDRELVQAANAVRGMLMARGYFVRNVLRISDEIVDLIAVRESLLNSERLRIRLVQVSKHGGLPIPAIKNFFREQARVFGLEGILVSVGPISLQARRYIEKNRLPVKDLHWLKENSDFEIYKATSEKITK